MKRYAAWLGMAAFTTTAMGAVTLGNAVRTGSELQFTVTGESNAIYIVEGSTNLQQWHPVITNREFAVARTVSVDVSSSRSYYRARVARPFTGALMAGSIINLQGNNIRIDSFDSADPLYSTGGQYDPSKYRDGGDVATSSRTPGHLNIGNAKIYGELAVGPGGIATLGPSGCVGSIAYVSNPNNAGTIQPGWFRNDMDAFFPDVILPSLGQVVPAAGTVGGTNYTYVLGNGDYRLNNLIMTANMTMLVIGRATLHVTGNVGIAGSAKIVVAPTGSLVLYVGGTATDMSGSGIVNQTYHALGFQYYGLPGNTSVTLASDFTGVIYAPRADVEIISGNVNTFDFSGAIVARSVTVNGNYQVHYDENLARSGPLF